ncbi:hypothetical protein L596_009807 [Steinernema carpocapsae]|uniref:Uncharacterized protein n=1 Tax=Steinernema carpocapsae TaxID=34508 RepID=A0A4U5PGX8_STECR|nr:hypothetical protein L596_009807 [Steinernema carpocapsae]
MASCLQLLKNVYVVFQGFTTIVFFAAAILSIMQGDLVVFVCFEFIFCICSLAGAITFIRKVVISRRRQFPSTEIRIEDESAKNLPGKGLPAFRPGRRSADESLHFPTL